MRFFLISLLVAFHIPLSSQILTSYIIDSTTNEVISDAFVFISNSSISTVSDDAGKFTIDRTALPNSDIVITHISYDTKYLLPSEMQSNLDTIYMVPLKYEMDEIVLKSKGSRKRKKWLQRFTKSLLGNTKNATKSQLTNPEVVLFEENSGSLTAITSDNLMFKNENLGYNIWFLLDEYTLEKDEDVLYSGKVFFENFENLEPKHLENRIEVYEKSSRKFFKDYTSGMYDSLQYRVALASLESDGFFHYIGDMKRKNLLSYSSDSTNYILNFPRFLRIENKSIIHSQEKHKSSSGFGTLDRPGLVIQKKSKNSRDRSDYAVSYLSSRTNQIIINRDGVIQNQRDIEEYGYWSDLRLADRLPDDFKYLPLKQ